MSIHQAALGFQTASEVYERGRPPYPPEAITFLAAAVGGIAGARVLDLAAGTGKLSRPLVDAGAHLIAIEPLDSMRQAFRRVPGRCQLLGGIAQALPLARASVRAAVIGNAFHWFADVGALAEVHRVLEPGGRLGLLWTAPDLTTPWLAEVMDLVDGYRGSTPMYRDGTWGEAFRRFGRFEAIARTSIPFQQTGDTELILEGLSSISFVACLPRPEREYLVEGARRIIRSRPAVSSVGAISVPYKTDIYIYQSV